MRGWGSAEVCGVCAETIGGLTQGVEPLEVFTCLEHEEVGHAERLARRRGGHGATNLGTSTSLRIRRTASSRPQNTAFDTMLWPILSSAISAIAATGRPWRYVRPWAACTPLPA